MIATAGPVLDLACGSGRHTRFFLDRGHPVVAVDREVAGLGDLRGTPGLEVIEADLETGAPFPLSRRRFAGVVVTWYLHRPRLADLVDSVAPGGVLLYETFGPGRDPSTRPVRPDFVLESGELLEVVRGELAVVAFEEGEGVQRLAAGRRPS
ncbi:MAG: class I SAM-dependent methyltransferase [Acidimicrobiales bacterium]